MWEECFSTLLKFEKENPGWPNKRAYEGICDQKGAELAEILSAQTCPDPGQSLLMISGRPTGPAALESFVESWNSSPAFTAQWTFPSFCRQNQQRRGAEEVFDQRNRAMKDFLQSHCWSGSAEVGAGWMGRLFRRLLSQWSPKGFIRLPGIYLTPFSLSLSPSCDFAAGPLAFYCQYVAAREC